MTPYKYLEKDKQVTDYLQALRSRRAPRAAVDLEGEYNLHHYGEHLCLVQIYDGEDAVIIDPQTVRIRLIKDFFEDPAISKVFYDCSGDRTLLYRKYGIQVCAIQDLLPAVELLEYEKKGLNAVLTQVLGLKEKNKKKFQQYNWMKRPIREDALIYAMEDVTYLLDLDARLMDQIRQKGLLEEYNRINQEVQSREIAKKAIPGLFRKNRFKKLPRETQQLFKELFHIREGFAERMDLPPNSVVSNENLYRLSQRQMTPEEMVFSRQVQKEYISSLRQEFQQVL